MPRGTEGPQEEKGETMGAGDPEEGGGEAYTCLRAPRQNAGATSLSTELILMVTTPCWAMLFSLGCLYRMLMSPLD